MEIYACDSVFTGASIDDESRPPACRRRNFEAARRSDAETQRRMSRDRHFFGG